MRATYCIFVSAALLLSSYGIAAQQLRDPTRPPPGAYQSGSANGAIKSTRSGMVLQTVLIAEDRQAAVISGQLMSVGDTISGFRLAEIHEGEVVMQKRSTTRTLRLFPGVNMPDSSVAKASDHGKGQR